MKIIHKSQGAIKDLLKKLKKVDTQIAVGVFDERTYENGMKVLDVAKINEFGSRQKNIPARSFIRSTATDKKDEVNKKTVKATKHFIENGNKQELLKVASFLAASMKERIVEGGKPFVANKAATIKAKGGNNTPLVGKEKLLFRSITWKEI